MKRTLLEQLTAEPLHAPCDVPWDEMIGDDKVRRCGRCERDVYSISDMTTIEADARLLNSGDEVPCVRYARDDFGAVIHVPLPRQPRSASRSLAMAGAVTAALAPAVASAADPVQCVVLSAPEPTVIAAADAPAPPASAPRPAAAAPAKPAARPASAPVAAAPAATPIPPPPLPLAGVPVRPKEPLKFGTLTVESKTSRDIKVAGISMKAPVAAYRLTPGDFTLEYADATGKARTVKFKINDQKTTTLKLP